MKHDSFHQLFGTLAKKKSNNQGIENVAEILWDLFENQSEVLILQNKQNRFKKHEVYNDNHVIQKNNDIHVFKTNNNNIIIYKDI